MISCTGQLGGGIPYVFCVAYVYVMMEFEIHTKNWEKLQGEQFLLTLGGGSLVFMHCLWHSKIVTRTMKCIGELKYHFQAMFGIFFPRTGNLPDPTLQSCYVYRVTKFVQYVLVYFSMDLIFSCDRSNTLSIQFTFRVIFFMGSLSLCCMLCSLVHVLL